MLFSAARVVPPLHLVHRQAGCHFYGSGVIQTADLAGKLTALLAAERAQREKNGIGRLVVSTAAGQLVIPVPDVDWIGAEDYYSRVHIGAKTYLLRESLGSLEARLDPARFVRVHRAAIVQVDRVRELRATERGDEVILRDGSHIPVSRRRRAMLDEMLFRR